MFPCSKKLCRPDFIVLLLSFTFLVTWSSFSQPAFPGAAGFGSDTPGGRGGSIIKVTNLNGSGAGSLRAACEANGARIVIFDVGGTINITKDISITKPFITIAGQTAPGNGICIKGAGLQISTHDVIIRGLRVRVGDAPNGPEPSNRDGISIANPSTEPYNIIIDHCSVSWAIDGNLDLWYPCHDITVQWSIISEGLHNSTHSKGKHSTGLLVGDHAQQISIHHNVFAHNNGRNPTLKFDTSTEIINNVIYSWGSWGATEFSNAENKDFAHLANIIGNYYKEGLKNNNPMPIKLNSDLIRPGTKVYVKDNIARQRPDSTADDWALVEGGDAFRVDEPVMPLSTVTISTAEEAFDMVLTNAGASPANRDDVDARIVKDVHSKSGYIIDSQNDVGGWPTYDGGSALPDSDNDGMPDEWETAHDLNPDEPADANSVNLSDEGYTNIEVYLNSLFEFNPSDVKTHKKNTPVEFQLQQNYPNPFNPSTTICFTLDRTAHVELAVYTVLGVPVTTLVDETKKNGSHEVLFDGSHLSSGIYMYTLKSETSVRSNKMILIK